ncbi:MAG: ferredoxin [Sinobacteraceae bacterium]|nr:ferredoxin [Nevskiaceae bacterium]
MKVIVDYDLCDAHGECVLAAPEIFDLGDDDDVVTLLQEEPPEELRAKAEAAVKVCPVLALRLMG